MKEDRERSNSKGEEIEVDKGIRKDRKTMRFIDRIKYNKGKKER